jgi:hypothetical protein
VEYVPFEAVVGGDADEVGDPVPFAVLEEVRTCKGCIPSEPKLSEPGPVALNKRRDKVQGITEIRPASIVQLKGRIAYL